MKLYFDTSRLEKLRNIIIGVDIFMVLVAVISCISAVGGGYFIGIFFDILAKRNSCIFDNGSGELFFAVIGFALAIVLTFIASDLQTIIRMINEAYTRSER